MFTFKTEGTARTIVSDINTAKAVRSGTLDVFATPMMIALMEEAACDCLSDRMLAGQTSVGTHIDVKHIAASAVGSIITAKAVIKEIDNKKITFDVFAYDADTEIGNGVHTRYFVDVEKFMQRLQK